MVTKERTFLPGSTQETVGSLYTYYAVTCVASLGNRESYINPSNQVSHLSLSSHPSNPPVKDYRDTWDTWDTLKCVRVALSIGTTLRGEVLYALCGWSS